MNQLLGLLTTALSIMAAAIVSGLRLKPYIAAGHTHTPLAFAFYPAVIAATIVVPVVFLLRRWQGKNDVDIGPVTFPGRLPFIALGCLIYILVAVTFFPYQAPKEPPTFTPPRRQQPAPPALPIDFSVSETQS
jgi:hypothetical protein